MSWYDAILWCNALTEYYNAKNNENLDCAYQLDSSIIRSCPKQGNNSICVNVVQVPTATGFRLPTTTEWGAASRWEGTSKYSNDAYQCPDSTNNWWTSGEYISGDKYHYLENYFGEYAWYVDNSSDDTHNVGERSPNQLGAHDMSGNVWEWNFDLNPSHPTDRVYRGGTVFGTGDYSWVGYWSYADPYSEIYWDLGFRLARTH
jgi:formylglycine-generating enzyme required for sulfatase activity